MHCHHIQYFSFVHIFPQSFRWTILKIFLHELEILSHKLNELQNFLMKLQTKGYANKIPPLRNRNLKHLHHSQNYQQNWSHTFYTCVCVWVCVFLKAYQFRGCHANTFLVKRVTFILSVVKIQNLFKILNNYYITIILIVTVIIVKYS